MKTYHNTKGKRMILLLAAVALVSACVPFPSYATSSTRQEIEEKNRRKTSWRTSRRPTSWN